MQMTRGLADRVASVAEILQADESDRALRRLTALGVRLVPGADAAAVTVEGSEQAHTFAASDQRLYDLHRLQSESGDGPAVETLRFGEPRLVTDVTRETRWPGFCQACLDAGFRSCLMLPLRSDRSPAGAVALYERDGAFSGASYDLALLFAAQGGTVVHNAEIYDSCNQMVANLHTALRARAVIEQAKGLLHARLGVTPEQAFRLLSRRSQDTNERVRDVAGRLMSGEINWWEFRSRRRH
jgi:hypothetical protein